ncbi:MAG: hypothetical protein VB026_05200 [Anaerolineaceae bacterium]|nr:hypothetical protein [Anaerolineaceae bacterium]
MSLNKTKTRFRANTLILAVELLLPFVLLYALRNDYTLLGEIVSAVLVLGIIFLVVFK